jgi:hypothetical protein
MKAKADLSSLALILTKILQRQYLINITSKVFFAGIAFFAKLALAFNGASANFVYDYGRMFGAEFRNSKMDFDAKIFYQNPLAFDWDSTKMENDGGKIVMFSAAFPFSVNSFILEPSFLFASGKWQRGNFDYFYGKPDLPSIFGFSMYFHRHSNVLGANCIFGKAKLLNNTESSELFNSDFYIYNIFYKLWIIRTGFASVNAKASGSLTAENQQYFIFPYSFYNASGYMNAKAIYSIANLSFKSKVAEYGMDLGALAALDGKIAASMNYKYRKFYGTIYGTEENVEDLNPVQKKNSGIVFSILRKKKKKINIGENYIQYGIQKPFAIPFGEIFPKASPGEGGDFLKDIFLWGLTASISVSF